MIRTFTIVATLSAALILGAGVLHAQNLDETSMTVRVPFEFSIGDLVFPAGEYHFARAVPYVTTFFRIESGREIAANLKLFGYLFGV